MKKEKNEYDYRALKERILWKFKRYNKFAEALGISKAVLSGKLNNNYGFTCEQIMASVELLEIETKEEIKEYFFQRKVKI